MFLRNLFYSLIVVYSLLGCQEQPASLPAVNHLFADSPLSTQLVAGILNEASGIADSKANAGFLWVEQDSGNPPEIALLAHTGNFKKKIYIKGAVNRDWEDLCLGKGPDPGLNYVYIAETGDNNREYASYSIYRFPEPLQETDTVFTWEKINFQYPDGPHDTETMFVDDSSKAIYLCTKNDASSKVYRLSYPQSLTGTATAVLIGELPFGGSVGAAISADSRELIIKTYTSLYYWLRQPRETIENTLKRVPMTLSYKLEIQGESVCFKRDNTGFFTLSEKPSGSNFVELNYYKRN